LPKKRNAIQRPKPRRLDRQKVVFAPQALHQLAAGFDELASLLALTLGPNQGPIFNAREDGSVELLTDAGSIARRVVEVPDRCRNTGAMILRNLAWGMHEQYGDGAATAAVLARAIVREAQKRIEAGVAPVHIRGGLEHALSVALLQLDAQSEPATGQGVLAAVAIGITGDRELGSVLGEIVDFLGPNAAVTIEEYPIPFLDREYVEGAYWRAHPAARAMIPESTSEIILERPQIMLADQPLDEIEDIQPALELAVDDKRDLLIIAPKVGDEVAQTFGLNRSRGVLSATAIVLNSVGHALTEDLDDIAILTDGCVLADIKGLPPRRIQREHFGTSRRVIVTRESLTIVDGAGDSTLIAILKSELERRLSSLSPNENGIDALEQRLARMNGGIAILKIGARIGMDLAHTRAEAEKAFRVVKGMVTDGVVPGGGVAYLNCIPALTAARQMCSIPGEEHGVDVLASALSTPFRQIVRNHGGFNPELALAEVSGGECGRGLDVVTGQFIDMREQRLLDSSKVVRGSLQMAVSAAASLLTTSVVILPADSKREFRPSP
jgi:chaperonin GroEL